MLSMSYTVCIFDVKNYDSHILNTGSDRQPITGKLVSS